MHTQIIAHIPCEQATLYGMGEGVIIILVVLSTVLHGLSKIFPQLQQIT